MSERILGSFCRGTHLFSVLPRYCTASLGDVCPMLRHGLVFPCGKFRCRAHSTVDIGDIAVFKNVHHHLSSEGEQEAVVIESIRRTRTYEELRYSQTQKDLKFSCCWVLKTVVLWVVTTSHIPVDQCFSTSVRPRPGKLFFFLKKEDEGPVPTNLLLNTFPFYVYWTLHHLDSWIKIDQLMSLALFFFSQHVSNASTFIFRSLRLCVGVLLCKSSTLTHWRWMY